ncbi:MAG: hypothetical protein DYG92_06570 [Leptolyngbya sp. PLA1]|nr:hypothetical protein [Leptolyngbya sp. PLA1]
MMHVLWTAAVVLGQAAGEPDLRTAAERTEYRETSTHAEIVRVLDGISAGSKVATRVSLGSTTDGKDLAAIVLADPPVRTAPEARAQADATGKIIVVAIGNIHAGEVEGKEALTMLARDIAAGGGGTGGGAILKGAIVLILPIYNADGNEPMSPTNRPHQNGPAAVGVRANARGRDLNRDFIKIEEAETRALVACFNDWDPHVFIDCHTTDGSYHRYGITYAGPKSPAGDQSLVAYSRDTFLPALSLAVEASTGKPTFWYGSFEGEFDAGPRGHSRWETFPADARFGTTYAGLRGRLSILSEAYVYDPFEERVENTRDFVRVALELAAENRATLRTLTSEADRRAIEAGHTLGEPDDLVAIRWKVVPSAKPVRVLGYEEEVVDGKSVRTDRTREYECELWDTYVPELSVVRPWGYALPDTADTRAAIEAIRRHGLKAWTLKVASEAEVERYEVVSATPASREFEGHVLVTSEVKASRGKREVPAGWVVVPTGQALGNLAVYMLEPQCNDGLAAWNAFDPWMQAGKEFPVWRLMSPVGPE